MAGNVAEWVGDDGPTLWYLGARLVRGGSFGEKFAYDASLPEPTPTGVGISGRAMAGASYQGTRIGLRCCSGADDE